MPVFIIWVILIQSYSLKQKFLTNWILLKSPWDYFALQLDGVLRYKFTSQYNMNVIVSDNGIQL